MQLLVLISSDKIVVKVCGRRSLIKDGLGLMWMPIFIM